MILSIIVSVSIRAHDIAYDPNDIHFQFFEQLTEPAVQTI